MCAVNGLAESMLIMGKLNEESFSLEAKGD